MFASATYCCSLACAATINVESSAFGLFTCGCYYLVVVHQRRHENTGGGAGGTSRRRQALRRPSNPAESCLVLGQPLPQQGGCSHAAKVSNTNCMDGQLCNSLSLTCLSRLSSGCACGCATVDAITVHTGPLHDEYDSPYGGFDSPAVVLHTRATNVTLPHSEGTPLAWRAAAVPIA